MIRRVKRIKPKKRFTPVKVVDPVKTGDELEYIFLPPLEPRRKLLRITSMVFGGWVVFLTVLYFTTVYPARHGKPAARPESPATAPSTQSLFLPPMAPMNTDGERAE